MKYLYQIITIFCAYAQIVATFYFNYYKIVAMF